MKSAFCCGGVTVSPSWVVLREHLSTDDTQRIQRRYPGREWIKVCVDVYVVGFLDVIRARELGASQGLAVAKRA